MGHYRISIEKSAGIIPAKPLTRVEVIGFLRTVKAVTPDDHDHLPPPEVTTLDVDGNPSPGTLPLPVTDELVRLASFEVNDPVARFIKIVTCSTAQSSPCLVYEGVSGTKGGNEESVHVLHKRKSADRVRSVYEATSDLLKKKGQDLDSRSEFLDGTESAEEALPSCPESLPKGKLSTFRVDLHELTTPGKVILRVDTDRDSVDYEGGTAVIKVLNVDDENGNSEQIQTSATSQEGEEPGTSGQSGGGVDLTVPERATVDKDEGGQSLDMATPKVSPVTMSITVANDLMIFVELDEQFESLHDGIPKVQVGIDPGQDSSTQSIVEPDTVFYLPYQNVFLDGLPASRTKTHRLPSYLEEKDTPEREERKKLLRKLILKRLLAFGTPNVTAHDITDTWYSGYVQHRALSYRIPKMRVEPKGTAEQEGNEPPKPVQIKIGTRLPDSAGFIENFIYHANFFKGILNSATCTAIECTFYLMLPHFKVQTEPNKNHLPGAGISPSFIRDWISIISTAAYQLKPTEPAAITDLVKKETKLMKGLLGNIRKEHKKMKERLQYILDKVEGLKETTYERIKLNPELALEIQRDEEPEDFGGFGHLQIVGFTGPQIFPNFLHFLTGKFGVFLKKDASEAWFPFSDLNFLERRVIFLGLMDHLHSSFSAILTTIRHLEEIYTPGYPMNLLTRLKPLDELIHRPKPYQLLATESKVALYGAICGCLGALKRFTYVYKELMIMVKDARTGMDKFDYSVPACTEFMAKLGTSDKVPKLNLTVPFATLNLEGFANLTARGTSVTVDEKAK